MLFSSLKNKIIYTSGGGKIGKIRTANVEYNTGKICELAVGSVFDFKGKFVLPERIVMSESKIIAKKISEKSEYIKDQAENIINFKVYTENGEYLGKVKDFDINTYLWRLAQIEVTNRLNAKKSLLISDDQIVSITAKKIIVKDLVIEEAMPSLA